MRIRKGKRQMERGTECESEEKEELVKDRLFEKEYYGGTRDEEMKTRGSEEWQGIKKGKRGGGMN